MVRPLHSWGTRIAERFALKMDTNEASSEGVRGRRLKEDDDDDEDEEAEGAEEREGGTRLLVEEGGAALLASEEGRPASLCVRFMVSSYVGTVKRR